MAGIRDVAKLANVSISTVSLVLNNNGYVSDETRKKITKAMEELNYVPNELARNLYHSKTNIIGIILPDISHPFFGKYAKYVEMELYARGYKTMLCSTAQKENGEKEYLNMLKRQMMDGIIVGTHTLESKEYQGIKRPIISLDRYINEEIPIVMSDHEKGGKLAAKELLDNGSKRVIQFVGSRRVNTPAHQHHHSFEALLRENGVEVYSEEMPWNKWDFEMFESFARKSYDKYKGQKIDALYGADLMIMACLKVAQENQIRIPQDLKLVGYDGTDITRMNALPITAVIQDVKKLAEQSVSLLLDKINEREIMEKRIIVDVTLQKGKTTI